MHQVIHFHNLFNILITLTLDGGNVSHVVHSKPVRICKNMIANGTDAWTIQINCVTFWIH